MLIISIGIQNVYKYANHLIKRNRKEIEIGFPAFQRSYFMIVQQNINLRSAKIE